MAEPESVSVAAGEIGELHLTFHPDWSQYVVALQRAEDDAPVALDDFFVEEDEELASPTVESLVEELRAGVSGRGRQDLLPFLEALAAAFARRYPERLDTVPG